MIFLNGYQLPVFHQIIKAVPYLHGAAFVLIINPANVDTIYGHTKGQAQGLAPTNHAILIAKWNDKD
ncbi:MAG: hypothetical protein C0403_11990 [Desulfobacterium sp.]|nr:hypothetical protein [Desulfobacterium sp.]